jgi:hypothetical protein
LSRFVAKNFFVLIRTGELNLVAKPDGGEADEAEVEGRSEVPVEDSLNFSSSVVYGHSKLKAHL